MGVEIETITPGDGGDSFFFFFYQSATLHTIQGLCGFHTLLSVFLPVSRTDIPEEGAARRGALCR